MVFYHCVLIEIVFSSAEPAMSTNSTNDPSGPVAEAVTAPTDANEMGNFIAALQRPQFLYEITQTMNDPSIKEIIDRMQPQCVGIQNMDDDAKL